MFEVVGEKEKLKPALQKFSILINKKISGGEFKEELKEEMSHGKLAYLEKVGVPTEKMIDKIFSNLEGMAVAIEETDDGFNIKEPVIGEVADKRIIGDILKKFMSEARDSVDDFLDEIRVCVDCQKGFDPEEVGEECPDCGEKLSKVEDYEIR